MRNEKRARGKGLEQHGKIECAAVLDAQRLVCTSFFPPHHEVRCRKVRQGEKSRFALP